MSYKINEPNISKFNNILIFPHIMPDGDAIGSSVAICYALRKIGKRATVVSDDELPLDLKFLDDNLIVDSEYVDAKLTDFDLCISIDVSSIDRLGSREKYIKAAPLWNIDHHKTNNFFGDYQTVEGGLSSACEVLYNILHRMEIEIDDNIATAIYTGLSSDTGSFKYEATTPKTHMVAADLISKGANFQKVVENLYMSKPLAKIRLESDVMSKAEFCADGKIAITSVSEAVVEKYKAHMNMADGIVEMLRDIDGVQISCLIKQRDDGVKISLRSKGVYDVSVLALEKGGGGHSRAAGFEIENISIDDAKQEMNRNILNILNGKNYE